MDITKEILSLRKKIDEDKEKQANIEGAQQAVMEQLKDEFGVISIDEARKLVESKEHDLESLVASYEKSIELFKRKYGFTNAD